MSSQDQGIPPTEPSTSDSDSLAKDEQSLFWAQATKTLQSVNKLGLREFTLVVVMVFGTHVFLLDNAIDFSGFAAMRGDSSALGTLEFTKTAVYTGLVVSVAILYRVGGRALNYLRSSRIQKSYPEASIDIVLFALVVIYFSLLYWQSPP